MRKIKAAGIYGDLGRLHVILQLKSIPQLFCSRWCSNNFSHARSLRKLVVKITYSVLSTQYSVNFLPAPVVCAVQTLSLLCTNVQLLWEIDCPRTERVLLLSGPPWPNGSQTLDRIDYDPRNYPNIPSSHSSKTDLVSLSSPTLVPLPMTWTALAGKSPPYTY